MSVDGLAKALGEDWKCVDGGYSWVRCDGLYWDEDGGIGVLTTIAEEVLELDWEANPDGEQPRYYFVMARRNVYAVVASDRRELDRLIPLGSLKEWVKANLRIKDLDYNLPSLVLKDPSS